MKFICDQCSTKYSIADEKVRRKVLKIRCKNCGNIIVVRDPARGTGALTAVSTEGGRVLDEAFQQVFSKSPPAARSVGPAPSPAAPGRIPVPAPALTETREHEPEEDKTRISLPGELRPPEAPVEDEWYLAIDGHQFGPMSFDELCRRVRRGEARSESGDEGFVWRDGFEDWIDAHSVPELRPFVPPPPPPRGRGSGLIAVPPDRAAAAAGLPVFRDAAQWPVPGGRQRRRGCRAGFRRRPTRRSSRRPRSSVRRQGRATSAGPAHPSCFRSMRWRRPGSRPPRPRAPGRWGWRPTMLGNRRWSERRCPRWCRPCRWWRRRRRGSRYGSSSAWCCRF
ncbi:MAG: zinc-ribbon domain-containing protein [Proteobacteria bacterium]|nr:zinc-ribbon domain-containing protein [Pseudomonadota bacterium]